MSYIQNESALGFFLFDWFKSGGQFPDEDCVAAADAASAEMFVNQQNIAKNWNPTGTYTIEDMTKVLGAGFAVMKAAGQVLDKARNLPQNQTSQTQLDRAREDLFEQGKKANLFIDARRDAVQKNIEFVSATGLKRWVIGVMEVAKGAIFTANYVACNRSRLLDVMASFFGVAKSAADTIMGIAGAVISAADQVLKVAESFDRIVKVSLVAGGALGAYWLWQKFGKPRSAQR